MDEGRKPLRTAEERDRMRRAANRFNNFVWGTGLALLVSSPIWVGGSCELIHNYVSSGVQPQSISEENYVSPENGSLERGYKFDSRK